MLDAFSTEVPVYLDKRYEIDTDPVNIKHPVALVSQHQLSFLFHYGLMHSFNGFETLNERSHSSSQ